MTAPAVCPSCRQPCTVAHCGPVVHADCERSWWCGVNGSKPPVCPVCLGSGVVFLLPVIGTDGIRHRGEAQPQSVVHVDRDGPVTNACLACVVGLPIPEFGRAS